MEYRSFKVQWLLWVSAFLWILLITISDLNAQEKITAISYKDNSPISVEIKDGKIIKVINLDELPGDAQHVYVAPGLIDNQVNGFGGISFSLGSNNLTKEGIFKATQALWKEGITTYLPTLTTNSHDILRNNFSLLKEAMDDPSLLGSLAGFHLEGPYISKEDGYRGAHPVEFVREPDWKEFMDYYRASGGHILQVTLAPETKGALEFISRCREKNIVVGLGHHNASAEIIKMAVDRGAQISTHLGNGCANMINRHQNPFWPQLSEDRLMISLICDGFHLRDEEIAVFYKVKGPEKTILTSDVTSFAGMSPGLYKNVEGDTIQLTKEGQLLYPEQQVLYGSAISLNRGVVKIMKSTGCNLNDAISMASTNPAKLYKMNDRGEITTGKRADLILFTIDGTKLNVVKTYVAGKLVYAIN